MNKNTRRLFLNNWAILATEKEELWHFGDIDPQKRQRTLDFVRSLSKLGMEIWGDEEAGIGTIRLRYPRPHPTHAREILIIQLYKYSIVISDPLVTTRLMTRIDVDEDILPRWDDIRTILAGKASVLYSQFYSREKISIDHNVVDELFQEAINAVTYNENVTAGNGQCSFSALSIEELLFFHTLLSGLFESHLSMVKSGRPWGVISARGGAPVHLEYHPPADPALISAFSSVIVSYCRLLFDASPERLIFNAGQSAMDFVTTAQNMFVINNPGKLLKLQRFVRAWKQVPPEVAHDLAPPMKDYFAELIHVEQRERIKKLGFHRVINKLTGMGIRRARSYRLPAIEDSKQPR